jgi:hypothetical protein
LGPERERGGKGSSVRQKYLPAWKVPRQWRLVGERVKRWEVGRENLSRDFTGFDRNYDVKVGEHCISVVHLNNV